MPVIHEQAPVAAAPAVNAAQQLALIQQRLEDLRQHFRLGNAPENPPPPPRQQNMAPRRQPDPALPPGHVNLQLNGLEARVRQRHVPGAGVQVDGREDLRALEAAAQALRRLQELRERQEQLAGQRQAREQEREGDDVARINLERAVLRHNLGREERALRWRLGLGRELQGWGPGALQQQPLVVMPQLGEAARVGIAGQERRENRVDEEARARRRVWDWPEDREPRGDDLNALNVDGRARDVERRVGAEMGRAEEGIFVRRNPQNPVGRANREAMVIDGEDEDNQGWRMRQGNMPRRRNVMDRWEVGMIPGDSSDDASSGEEDAEPFLAPRERPRVLRLGDPRDPRVGVGLRPHGGLWRPRGWQQQDIRGQTVFSIRCGWCHTLVSTRGLIAPPSGINGDICSYTSDLPIPGTVGQISEERTRQCYCVSANIACHCCGNTLGHHVRSLCSECRKVNHGHTWVFGAAHVDVCVRTLHAAHGPMGDTAAVPRTWESLKPASDVCEHEAVPSLLSDVEALR